MRKYFLATTVLILTSAVLVSAATYRVRWTARAEKPITMLAGNPCGFGWLPASVSTPYRPAADSDKAYLVLGCNQVNGTGLYHEFKVVLVAIDELATPVAAPLNCAVYGVGWRLSANGLSCLPPGYPE